MLYKAKGKYDNNDVIGNYISPKNYKDNSTTSVWIGKGDEYVIDWEEDDPKTIIEE